MPSSASPAPGPISSDDLEDVAGLRAGELLVERSAELARAHEVEVVGAGEPVDLLVPGDAFTSIVDEVAVDHRSVGRLELGEPLAEPVDPLVDVALGRPSALGFVTFRPA